MAQRLNIFKNNTIQKLLSFLVLVVIFCIGFWMLWSITGTQPLVHDEAVYLTKARSWIEGTPANEFRIYRSIGIISFGWIFLHFDDSEKFLRIFGDIFGAISLVFIYLLFKRITNTLVALSITVLIGTSPLFLQQAPQFLSDIPSAGLLIGTLWLILVYYQSEGRSISIYFAALFAIFAFYIRYGIAASLGVIGILSFFLLIKKNVNREDIYFPRLQVAIVIFFILLFPHFIQSTVVEGKFFGILLRYGDVAGSQYLGEGLLKYIQILPSSLAGELIGISAILGIIVTLVVLFRKNLRQNYEELWWLGSIGLINIILVGLLVHAEGRFAFFSLVLLSGVGIMGVYFFVRSRLKTIANLLIGIFIVITLYFGTIYYRDTDKFFGGEEDNLSRNAYVEASEVIRKDTGGGKCAVWASFTRPEISWYSRCNTLIIEDASTFKKDFLIHFRKSHYSIVFTKLKSQQVKQNNAEEFGVLLTEIYRSKKLSQALGELVVYRINGAAIERNQKEREHVIYE